MTVVNPVFLLKSSAILASTTLGTFVGYKQDQIILNRMNLFKDLHLALITLQSSISFTNKELPLLLDKILEVQPDRSQFPLLPYINILKKKSTTQRLTFSALLETFKSELARPTLTDSIHLMKELDSSFLSETSTTPFTDSNSKLYNAWKTATQSFLTNEKQSLTTTSPENPPSKTPSPLAILTDSVNLFLALTLTLPDKNILEKFPTYLQTNSPKANLLNNLATYQQEVEIYINYLESEWNKHPFQKTKLGAIFGIILGICFI